MSDHNSIRARLRRTMTVGSLLLLLVQLLIVGGYILSVSVKIKQQQQLQATQRLQLAVNHSLDDLHRRAEQQAGWDDTYRFVADANLDFVTRQMSGDRLKRAGLLAMLVLDANGNWLHGNASGNRQLVDQLLAAVERDLPADMSAAQGFAQLGTRLLVFTRLPISDSTRTLPANGSLVLFAEPDLTLLQALDPASALAPQLLLPANQQARLFPVTGALQVVNDGMEKHPPHLLLQARLHDQQGALPVTFALKLQDQAQFALNPLWLLIPAIVGALLMVAYFWWRAYYYVVLPHVALRAAMAAAQPGETIGKSPRLTSELMTMVDSLNAMLERLNSERQFNQNLLKSIGDVIISVDGQQRLTFANDAARRWLGLEQELLGLPLSLLLSDRSCEQDPQAEPMARWLHQLLHLQRPLEREVWLQPCGRNRQPWHGLLNAQPLGDQQGAVLLLAKLSAVTTPGDGWAAWLDHPAPATPD